MNTETMPQARSRQAVDRSVKRLWALRCAKKRTWKKHTFYPDARFDLLGRTFGMLRVIQFAGRNSTNHLLWRCSCECGGTCIAIGRYLRERKKTQCGCLTRTLISKAVTKHGGRNTSEYRSWCAMKARCYNKNNLSFYRYGARGITITPEWFDFAVFYRDVGPKPSPKHSLERINNNGNYTPENCRWASKKDQNFNRSNSLGFDVQGYATSNGISYQHAWRLFKAGRLK